MVQMKQVGAREYAFATPSEEAQETTDEKTVEMFINNLKTDGAFIGLDQPSIDLFKTEASKCVQCFENSRTHFKDALQLMCEIITKSEVCQVVEQDDLMNCTKWKTDRQDFSAIDLVSKCSSGVWESAVGLFQFIWKALKWTFEKSTHPIQTYQEASEMMDFVKLYVATEFDKAYDREKIKDDSFGLDMRATMALGTQIMQDVLNPILKYLEKEYDQFACLNHKARTEAICNMVSDVFMPPLFALSVIKFGPKAIKSSGRKIKTMIKNKKTARQAAALQKSRTHIYETLLKRPLTEAELDVLFRMEFVGEGFKINRKSPVMFRKTRQEYLKIQARKRRMLEESGFFSNKQIDTILDSRNQALIVMPRVLKQSGSFSKRSIDHALSERNTFTLIDIQKQAISRKGQQALNRRLTVTELQAIRKAHHVGLGSKGKNGQLATKGNYTVTQLKQKMKILRQAGFAPKDISTLMRKGVVGYDRSDLAKAVAFTKSSFAAATSFSRKSTTKPEVPKQLNTSVTKPEVPKQLNTSVQATSTLEKTQIAVGTQIKIPEMYIKALQLSPKDVNQGAHVVGKARNTVRVLFKKGDQVIEKVIPIRSANPL